MSLVFRPEENMFVKWNRIEPSQEWSIPFWDFVTNKKYDEVKEIFSKKNYYEVISFSIQMDIADLDKEYKTNIPHNLQLLLKHDCFDIFTFKTQDIIPDFLTGIPINWHSGDYDIFNKLFILRQFASEAIKEYQEFTLHVQESYIDYIKRWYRDVKDSDEIGFGLMNEDNYIMEYLLFMFFVSDEELFIISDRYWLNFILTNECNLHKYLSEYSFIFNLRSSIESYFSETELEEFNSIREKYGKKWSDLDIMKSIEECCDIDKAFRDWKYSGKIKNGKPATLEVSAHTTDRDINKWQEKLWKYKKIESNEDNDSIISLKVTKKFK